jgi:hypothetical protein
MGILKILDHLRLSSRLFLTVSRLLKFEQELQMSLAAIFPNRRALQVKSLPLLTWEA